MFLKTKENRRFRGIQARGQALTVEYLESFLFSVVSCGEHFSPGRRTKPKNCVSAQNARRVTNPITLSK
jgi:hypothetical protein